MTPTQLLFGEFPRTVAAAGVEAPHQRHVFSEGEFYSFLDAVREKRNVYSSISVQPIGQKPRVDKVPFDFDSPVKDVAFTEDENDCEKVEAMRDDPWLANEVLGAVLDDAQTLAEWSKENKIPGIAVFSGLGIHFYLLYREEVDPKEEMRSTNIKLTEELDLKTSDTVVSQPERILRVPNCRRVATEDDEIIPCDVWTIPIERDDLIHMTVEDLLAEAETPNEVDVGVEYLPENRPEMQVYEGYNEERKQVKELGEQVEVADAEIEYILEKQIKMPCISERAKQQNPDHEARFVFAVTLFNLGYNIEECVDIIRRLNWSNFDADKTRKYLRQIYEHGYSKWSCEKMIGKGLCVHEEDPSNCPTFMKNGERCKWK